MTFPSIDDQCTVLPGGALREAYHQELTVTQLSTQALKFVIQPIGKKNVPAQNPKNHDGPPSQQPYMYLIYDLNTDDASTKREASPAAGPISRITKLAVAVAEHTNGLHKQYGDLSGSKKIFHAGWGGVWSLPLLSSMFQNQAAAVVADLATHPLAKDEVPAPASELRG